MQNRVTAMKLLRARLLELEERKRAEKLAAERGERADVAWGSQIRSYFLHPSQRVKDHRTGFEVGDAERVLDGDIDGFVREYLLQAAGDGKRAGGDS
jgi:peptide chain release factor 2